MVPMEACGRYVCKAESRVKRNIVGLEYSIISIIRSGGLAALAALFLVVLLLQTGPFGFVWCVHVTFNFIWISTCS